MNSSQIIKHQNKSTPALKKLAIKVFNSWIRKRDEGQPCISCGSFNTAHASHFYSAGKHTNLRFNEDNCHLACVHCNYFEHGNLLPYRENLIKKIGLERVEKLDLLSKVRITKQDRFLYLEIIETYKNKAA